MTVDGPSSDEMGAVTVQSAPGNPTLHHRLIGVFTSAVWLETLPPTPMTVLIWYVRVSVPKTVNADGVLIILAFTSAQLDSRGGSGVMLSAGPCSQLIIAAWAQANSKKCSPMYMFGLQWFWDKPAGCFLKTNTGEGTTESQRTLTVF